MSLLFNTSIRSNWKSINQIGLTSNILKNSLALRVTHISSQNVSPIKEDSDEAPQKTYKEIFRFPYIKFGYAINKFKWTQTLLSAFALPTSVALYFGGILDSSAMYAVIISGALVTANLYAYGSIFHQAVGFMYLSEDGSTLKISYLDFWGTRVDVEVPVEDVMTLTESPRDITDYVYRTVHLYSTEKLKPKLYLKTGGKITDLKNFVRVFGDYTS